MNQFWNESCCNPFIERAESRMPNALRSSKVIVTAVPVIMMVNIGVFFLWTATGSLESPSPFMAENFLVSMTALAEWRVWTLVTSAFSHNLFWHLFLNMYVLGSFGDAVEETLGTWKFVTFYLFASILGSLGHSLLSTWLLGSPDLPALGASGAISGLILLFSFLHPRERIFLFGLIPVPAAWGSALFIGLDLWGLFQQHIGNGLPIGHGAHLGGALAGILYYWLFLKKRLGANSRHWHPSKA
jgi:membrane associated rhomboid family serine protease